MQPLVAPCLDWAALAQRMRTRHDEIDDLMALLLDHADRSAGSKADLYHVAWLIACASLGDQHLWQDLGLPSRDALSALISHWFPALKTLNSGDMKWKKFFYRQLCLKEEILICKSPSCAQCSDQPVCFGPELPATAAQAAPRLQAR
ncbi:MAG: nitrogen fixation protein NifQ [Hydrogenophaga sp.]|nr:nitrogen fixation protein NifQ [Hydrogenophaga sp.]